LVCLLLPTLGVRTSDSLLVEPTSVHHLSPALTILTHPSQYAYSAWAPQYAERLKLSATQSNLIVSHLPSSVIRAATEQHQGSAGNIGMYASGIPFGILIDTKGPRWAILIGAVSLACGYFPLYSAYQKGPESTSFGALCLYGFLAGMGGCSAFAGSIKVSATNWPHHRGTATAFPLSALGLSAFVFTLIGSFAFPNDTGDYLLMLAVGTFSMVFVGSFFMRLLPPSSPYQAVPTEDEGRAARIRKSHSREGSRGSLIGEPSKSCFFCLSWSNPCLRLRFTHTTAAPSSFPQALKMSHQLRHVLLSLELEKCLPMSLRQP
jgi:MFS family permease